MGRSAHGNALLDGKLYIYGGSGEEQEFLKSVEVIKLRDNAPDAISLLIENHPDELVPSRLESLFCPISNHQILLMGGRNEQYQESADIFIFDTNKLTFKKQKDVKWPTESEPFSCDRIMSDYN